MAFSSGGLAAICGWKAGDLCSGVVEQRLLGVLARSLRREGLGAVALRVFWGAQEGPNQSPELVVLLQRQTKYTVVGSGLLLEKVGL